MLVNMRAVDFLLVLCPPWSPDTPPLGPNMLVKKLADQGYDAEFFDLNILLFNRYAHMNRYWGMEYCEYWTQPPFFNDLLSNFLPEVDQACMDIAQSARIVGFSAYQDNINMIMYMARKLKELNPRIVTVAGGPSCKIEEQRSLLGDIDFIDQEGELVKGMLSKRKVLPEKRADKIPYRDRESTGILMSSGCVGVCTFCNDRILMGKYASRDPDEVFSEIKSNVAEGKNSFIFHDLLINGNAAALSRLCDFIIGSRLKVRWIANAIPMNNLTPALLARMKGAGCHTLMLGIETGSQKVLTHMRKHFTVDEGEQVLRHSHEAGIMNWINLIVGYPTETEEDFRQTLAYIERNREFIDRFGSVNTCNIVPQSELYRHADNYGIVLVDGPAKAMNWHTADGENTDAVRQDRLRRLLDKISSLKLEVQQTNMKNMMFSRRAKGMTLDIDRKYFRGKSDLVLEVLAADRRPAEEFSLYCSYDSFEFKLCTIRTDGKKYRVFVNYNLLNRDSLSVFAKKDNVMCDLDQMVRKIRK